MSVSECIPRGVHYHYWTCVGKRWTS